MKIFNKIYLPLAVVAVSASLLFTGCEEETLIAPDFDRENELLNPQNDPLDKWVASEFTTPYNIEVIWRWNRKETGYDRNYIPPTPSNVQPFLTVLKKAFISTYETNMGPEFIKPLIPKQFLLLGEWGYNNDGSRTLAQAEMGSKFVFYGVDHWDERYGSPGNYVYPNMREAIHTMFHEFGHILHQNKLFTEDFQKVSKEHYTVRWTDFNDLEARVKGFASNYSMLNHNEDFVELIAFYTTLTPEAWEEHISSAVTAAENDEEIGGEPIDLEEAKKGYEAILTKIALVKDYLKSSWDIDLDEVRDLALKNADEALSNATIVPTTGSSVSVAPLRSPYTHHLVLCTAGEHPDSHFIEVTPEETERN
ncbi:MAG: putative zinc-binding metallopeptidase [Porphyromonas sp.]|nr:putative zinc-binding metallopeptidase [Porphyromonas sp.]